MSDANSNAAAADASGGNAANPECGKDSLNRFVERTRHSLSGARLTIEKCPDATTGRTVKGAAVLGSVLTGGSFLLRRSRFFMIAAGVGGALLGAIGSRYHVSFDWDPDRAFGGDRNRGELR